VTGPDRSARLRMSGIRKAFGATVALDGVDLRVRAGEVQALVGENGAGKSTLMKVLSGAVRPDAGSMELDGVPYRPVGPLGARRCGVAMIYQELNLAPHQTVEENVTLGLEQTRFGLLRRRAMRARVQAALGELQHPDIRPDTRVRDLGAGAGQLVEIARALVTEARVLVLDEPTSSLPPEDVERLFGIVRRLRDRGVSVVYISHFIEEVQRVAERFTVLRDGRVVGGGDVASTAADRIVEMMVGRSLGERFPRVAHTPGEVALRLKGLTGARLPTGVDLEVRRGEILGLAGLIGSGRTELLRAVFGLDRVESGEITVGSASDRGGPPHRRVRQGLGLLSEDRRAEGVALPLSVADNVTLSRLSALGRWGILSLTRQARAAGAWVDRLGIRTRGPAQPVRELSGGNQQKVAVARLLHQDAEVLLLDEPTRGIDVGAKTEIFRLMGNLAAEGKAVVFVSSTLPELMGVCDRIGVLHRGRLVGVRPVAEWTPEAVMDAAARGAA
jgi:ribose transport system ATP-binding protein